MPERILVTGGAGFIGSNLVEALVAAGHDVVVLDDLSTGKESNLAAVASRVTLRRGSVGDEAACREAVAGCSVVFHEAAVASVPRSVAEPVATHHINATSTLVLLEACRAAGVRRLVFAASSAAYGDDPTPVKHEGLAPRPLSPYAAQKVAGEHYLSIYHRLHGLETVALRYFNVFGRRQDPKSEYAAVIPKFIARMTAGQRPIIFGDGLQSRDFVHVDDVVAANIAAMTAPGAAGGVFNVGCGRAHSLLDLVAALNAILGTRLEPQHDPPAPGDVRDSLADVSRAAQALGWRARVSLEEGLRRTIDAARAANP